MPPTSTAAFSLPSTAQHSLNRLVQDIEANQGDLIRPNDFGDSFADLNVRSVISRLPAGMTEQDFIGTLKLSLLTECATESYAALICESADRYEAPWLRHFVDRVWTPDELTHFAPYKLILLNLGFAEAELDAEIQEARDIQYEHIGGLTPVALTTFGMIQEYLTDSWHGLTGKLLRETAPESSAMVMRVKRRETLHSVWYRDMTALQVEANPGFVTQIASEIGLFRMPSTSVAPAFHGEGHRWQTLLGADSEQMFRDLFRFVQETLGNVRLTGELVMRLAAMKNVKLGPIPTPLLEKALRRLGGPGYGLIGEAVLERGGLSYMFAKRKGSKDRVFSRYDGAYEQVRSLVRSWIASLIPAPEEVVVGN